MTKKAKKRKKTVRRVDRIEKMVKEGLRLRAKADLKEGK